MNGFTEAVNGVVVGNIQFAGGLYYLEQKQGNTIFADSEAEVVAKGRARLAEIKEQCGKAYLQIYPETEKWTVRIYETEP